MDLGIDNDRYLDAGRDRDTSANPVPSNSKVPPYTPPPSKHEVQIALQLSLTFALFWDAGGIEGGYLRSLWSLLFHTIV